jgi:hypothetical protein
MKNCKKCGNRFEPTKGLVNYCSLSCRNSREQNEDVNNKRSEKMKYRKLSEEHIKKISGSNNGNWRGGVSLNKKNHTPKCIGDKYLCKFCEIELPKKKSCCENCKPFIQNIKLFKKLKIYKKKTKLSDLNKIALEKLYEEYFINKKSKLVLKEEYGLMSNTIYDFFKKNNITLRTLNESALISYEKNRQSVRTDVRYKQGWHTTWDGEKVFYHSSYELDYAKQLDEEKISYEMESLRIRYFDTQKNKERIAIPDFYLPKTNTIIEIKSDHTLDKKNMSDKVKRYKEMGYNFKLILEGNEFKLK